MTAGQRYYVEILFKENTGGDHVSLWWTLPGETEPEVIGSEYLHSYVQPEDDADMDGLPDSWEIAVVLIPPAQSVAVTGMEMKMAPAILLNYITRNRSFKCR